MLRCSAGSSFQLARVLRHPHRRQRLAGSSSCSCSSTCSRASFRDTLGASTASASRSRSPRALLFFGSILLHELGHALAARREGIEVTGIDLFLFGGVMKMSRDTARPGQEFRVAAAGPLVTLLIVIVGGAARRALIAGSDRLFDAAPLSGNAVERRPDRAALAARRRSTSLLLVFNLIPAFPLDGGRIARAVAWKITGDRGKATALLGAASARASPCC